MFKPEDHEPTWQSNPTRSEVYLAYKQPWGANHWYRINQLVLNGGFHVEKEVSGQNSLPEFKIMWPSPEAKELDYQLFFEVSKMIIGTLHLDDRIFTKSVLPTIFQTLEKSSLYSLIFAKISVSQKNSVRHHIEMVPTLIQTDEFVNSGKHGYKERFISRTVAIFHDMGKAFNIGRDQAHYHALIASNIFKQFMSDYEEPLTKFWLQYESKQGLSSTGDNKSQFQLPKNEISEMIRLHHVLEQIDKGVLDLETVAEIFADNHVNPLIFGIFIIADGSSVIPDNPKYAQFLFQNLQALEKLMDLLVLEEIDEADLSFIQATQHLIALNYDMIQPS
jgi:hypothetical protein